MADTKDKQLQIDLVCNEFNFKAYKIGNESHSNMTFESGTPDNVITTMKSLCAEGYIFQTPEGVIYGNIESVTTRHLPELKLLEGGKS